MYKYNTREKNSKLYTFLNLKNIRNEILKNVINIDKSDKSDKSDIKPLDDNLIASFPLEEGTLLKRSLFNRSETDVKIRLLNPVRGRPSNVNNIITVSCDIEEDIARRAQSGSDTESENFMDIEINKSNMYSILSKVNSIKINIGENKVIFYKKNINIGHTSFYFSDLNNKYFMKIPYTYIDYDLLRREIFILKKLEKYDCFPKILFYNNILFVTEYIGDIIKKNTIPDNIIFQINDINNILLKERIIHSDIKQNEMLIKDNKLYIIDFGWSRYNNKWSCDIGLSNKTKPNLDNTSDIQKMINIIIRLLN